MDCWYGKKVVEYAKSVDFGEQFCLKVNAFKQEALKLALSHVDKDSVAVSLLLSSHNLD